MFLMELVKKNPRRPIPCLQEIIERLQGEQPDAIKTNSKLRSANSKDLPSRSPGPGNCLVWVGEMCLILTP
jgi:hypothetical protein